VYTCSRITISACRSCADLGFTQHSTEAKRTDAGGRSFSCGQVDSLLGKVLLLSHFWDKSRTFQRRRLTFSDSNMKSGPDRRFNELKLCHGVLCCKCACFIIRVTNSLGRSLNLQRNCSYIITTVYSRTGYEKSVGILCTGQFTLTFLQQITTHGLTARSEGRCICVVLWPRSSSMIVICPRF
jgi:hypothetical protein